MVFGAVTGLFMLGPLLPDMARDLGTSVPVMAQLVTLSSLSWAATALMVGPLSDTYGRKPVLLLGAALAGFGSLGTALSDSFAMLAVFRLVVGIGSGMIPPTAIALIGDVFPPERKAAATGVFVAIPGASNLVGIPLAAVLSDAMGWQASFAALGLLMLLSAAAFSFLCPRLPRSPGASMDYAARLKRVFSLRLTWYLLGIGVLSQLVYGAMMVFFPTFLRLAYGLSASQVALPVALFAVGTIGGPLLGGKVAGGPRRLSGAAITLMGVAAFALGAFLLQSGLWLSVAMAAALMLGLRMNFVVLLTVGSDAGGLSRGTLLGVLVMGNQGGVAAGTSLGGLLLVWGGYGMIGLLCAAAAVGASLLFRFAVREPAIARSHEYFSDTDPPGK